MTPPTHLQTSDSVPSTSTTGRQPKVHFSFWFYGHRAGRVLKPHHVRDALAAIEMLVALLARGYEVGQLYLNFPPTAPIGDSLLQIDLAMVGKGDLVVVPTRPPLDDQPQGDRIKIEPAFTNLEQIILSCARRDFEALSRSHIRLAPRWASRLPEAYATRADMWVRVFNNEAWYRECKTHSGVVKQKFQKDDRRTPAFLLRYNDVPELNGADLVIAFGMGGTETLVWSHWLRTKHSHLLDRPGFTLVELVLPPDRERPERPTSPDFANDWLVEPILQLPRE